MAYIEEANELMTDATGQSIATAIGNMSATSVGNLAALQTTDKTSLVGAVNEVKSGLTGLILRKTITVGDFTIAANSNYYRVTSETIDPPSGYTPICANISYWGSLSNPISASFTRDTANSVYIFGAPSTVVTGLKIEVIFVKSDMISEDV